MNIVNILQDRERNNNIASIKNLQVFEPFIDRFDLREKLIGHEGCVNCLEFTSNGNVLASASDDLCVFLWDPYQGKVLKSFQTPHRGNIFSVKFLPKTNDQQLVTGAADHCMYAFDLHNTDDPIFKCRCHQSRVKRIACVPEVPSTFFSSSEDGCVFQIDLREPHTCVSEDKIVLVDLSNHQEYVEAKCIAVNPRRPEQLAIGTNDAYARLYDRRMITLMSHGSEEDNLSKGCVRYYAPGHLQASTENFSKAITFVSFSPNGSELLVNYGAEQIYLFEIDKSETPIYLNLPKLSTEPASKPPKNEKVDSLRISGNEFLETEKYIQAIRQYTEAIQITSNNPVLYLNRATALMRRKYLGDCYEALRDCHRALYLDSHYIKAHFRLARALYEINQLTLSNDCLQELKKRFPSHQSDQSVKMLELDINQALSSRSTSTHRDSNPEKLSENEMFWRHEARDYKQRYIGHCNTKTDIKEANFFGQNGEYIIAGSDDGNFYLWERKTSKLKSVYKADKAIVNCVQPHPFLPLIATSGIDHDIGIWSPQPIDKMGKYKVMNELIDNLVGENQNHMQNESYELGLGSENICRTS
ncbi:CLUMA_CG004476, isoform A [Clunio marinus]|uniref:CLUMA_CG004476, isoform A n=1 Tax=Clunio marinus TaxID=568069 RepID=A0A1J1HRS8_9DIPT|nr:CLUMA_CG004476, isoform A [Clunio marinus]